MAKREADKTSKTVTGSMTVKRGLAEMLKGGVIMDVVNAEQAKIAEDAGACAVMALERVPADIRRDGGVARMSDPEMIVGIQAVCSIPVMAKARIGHFVEAQVLESLGVDFIDESEVLTPADEAHHIDKLMFTSPFVCGATNLGEALRRISEGAALIRSKGEAGTGNIVEAVRHLRSIIGDIRKLLKQTLQNFLNGQSACKPRCHLCKRLPKQVGCKCHCFAQAELQHQVTPHWRCNLGHKQFSLAPEFLRAMIRPRVQKQSLKQQHTFVTPTSLPR
jgi:pyridoxal 5'-phosphate synthase subunit Pdx1